MANWNRELDDLGRSIQQIVDRAVNSRDFQQLNQTITQAVERAVGRSGETFRKAEADANARQEKQLALYGSAAPATTRGVLQIVGGSALTGFSLALSTVAGVLAWMMPVGWVQGVLAAGILGGGALICGGINGMARVKRFKTYRKILGDRTHCSLDRLARGVGKNVSFVRREVKRMIGQGLFPEGHLDNEQTRLIVSDETYREFERSRKELEQRRKQAAEQPKTQTDARVAEVMERGNAFLRDIRRCNDAIPGEEISAKIDRMEQIVRRIFLRAQSHPQIVPDLKKLMDYYLPMTVKLLDAYADMDAQPIQGQTIQSAKQEIEQSLDTLNRAYEKLLDQVFQETALDVSSDISVLNTLLAQEGLTGNDFTEVKQ